MNTYSNINCVNCADCPKCDFNRIRYVNYYNCVTYDDYSYCILMTLKYLSFKYKTFKAREKNEHHRMLKYRF